MAFVKFNPNLKLEGLENPTPLIITHVNKRQINWGINAFTGNLGVLYITPQGEYHFEASTEFNPLNQDEFLIETTSKQLICLVINVVHLHDNVYETKIGRFYAMGGEWIPESNLEFEIPINQQITH